MYLNLQLNQKVAQISYYIFVFITCISKIQFTLVSSENVSNIPLSLYQTKHVEFPEVQHNVLDEKLENVFKRATKSAFYGLRGKKLPIDAELESVEEKRSAFYPMRGKKKPSTFTALRGKKEFDTDIYDSDSPSKENFQLQQGKEQNATPMQNSDNSEKTQRYLKTSGFGSDDDDRTSSIPEYSQPHIDSESLQPWRNILNHGKLFLDSRNNMEPNIIDNKGEFYDDIESKSSEENKSDDYQMMDKRRTSGFIPMRGRKFYSEMGDQYSTDKRKSSFIPMRGRKSNIDEEWPISSNELSSEVDKKSVGFLPMRGRRSIFSQIRGNRLYQKSKWPFSEGKRVAFHAVRGKKNTRIADWNYPRQVFYSSRDADLNEDDNEISDDISGYMDSLNKDFPISSNHETLLRIKRSLRGKLTRGKSRVGIKRPAIFFASRGKRFGSQILPQSSLYSV